MTIYLIGNPSVPPDSLPYRLEPYLRSLPGITVVHADPAESFIPEEGSVIVDSVAGLSDVRLFTGLDAFRQASGITAHDYDLLLHLELLRKLGKIRTVRIIGVPPDAEPGAVSGKVIGLLG